MAHTTVGTKFRRGDGASSETFTDIADINSIDGPNMSRETIDTTSLDTAGGYRTFIGSFRDGGQVDLDANFSQTGYAAFLADFQSEIPVNYQLQWPDGAAGALNTQLDFAALCTAHGTATAVGDKIQMRVSLKITGQVVLTS